MAGKVSTAKGLFLKFEAALLWAPLTEHGTEDERFCRAVGHALAPQWCRRGIQQKWQCQVDTAPSRRETDPQLLYSN